MCVKCGVCVYVECIWDIYVCGLVYVCVVWYECMYMRVYGMCVYVVWCVYMGSICGMCVMCPHVCFHTCMRVEGFTQAKQVCSTAAVLP